MASYAQQSDNWGVLGQLYQMLTGQGGNSDSRETMMVNPPQSMGRGGGGAGSSYQPSAAAFSSRSRDPSWMQPSAAYERLVRMQGMNRGSY